MTAAGAREARHATPDAARHATPDEARHTAKRRVIRRLSMAVIALTLVVGAALPPAIAQADAAHKIHRLCEEAKSIEGFTMKDYIKAAQTLTAYEIEYGDCAQLIEEAELNAAGGKHRGGSKASGGSTLGGGIGGSQGGSGPGTQAGGAPGQALPTTPEEQRQIAHAQHSPMPVALGKGPAGTIHPGVVHADVSSALSSLPASLLAMIAALIATIAGFVGWTLRARMMSVHHPS